MKSRWIAGVLSAVLTFSMLAGTFFIPGSARIVQAAQEHHEGDRVWDLSTDASRPFVEGTTGEYQGILIDAAKGKFSPRTGDTQINAGTVLMIPVEANAEGAELTIQLSGSTSQICINGTEQEVFSGSGSYSLEARETDGTCVIEFLSQSYVKTISLSYQEPAEEYPGIPEEALPEDKTYSFASAAGLLDESGNPAEGSKLEGNRGTFEDMKVDAAAGKFNIQPDQNRAVVNAGTVLYIPAAYDEKGAVLLIAGTQDGHTASQIKVEGTVCTSNAEITLDMSDAASYPRYLKVEFDTICYVNTISLNYGSDSDYGTPVVEAKDKTWDFTESSPVERPAVQGAKGEFDGIQIDATTGKFSPRTAAAGGNDTQIAAGTTLYIPVAPDTQGASIMLSGNNYNNLTVLLDGTEIFLGKETALPAVEENTYLPLEFLSEDGTGSCYLTGITVDYMSDSTVNARTVTVGLNGNCDYTSIQEALNENESSASEPLVLLIAPGTYTEKVTVDKPWVSFQPMYSNGGEIVIEESYYSSNTFNAEGEFIPQDEYDVGTDQCGTVLLTANATGFSASGITFQNSYNIADHTGEGQQTPAAAFGSAADKVYLKNCQFLGRQDTLYLHGAGARVQVEDCYIEGTVDFIFGDAEAYFLNCKLHMAGFAGRDTGYFTAANTKKGNVGFVFSGCTLTVDPSYGEGSTVSLGRPWQTECYTETARREDGSSYLTVYDPEHKNPAYENTSSAAMFIECSMDPLIQDERWSVWTRKDQNGETRDVTYHEDVRFAEINSKDPSGNYLAPEDYKEITLGTMEVTEDARDQIKELLDQMGFGSSIGKWTPSFTDYSSVQPAEMVFTDVPKEAWYYSYVKYVFEKGLMTGLSDTVFAPTEEVARAQAALILYRIGGETPSEYRPVFPDVPEGVWFTDAIIWANSRGILTGYENTGLFGPGDTMNREQLVTMLYRYAKYQGYDVSDSKELSGYQDAAYVSSFAEDAMKWAVGAGIITGKYNETVLDPQGCAARAECAAVIMRFAEKYNL